MFSYPLEEKKYRFLYGLWIKYNIGNGNLWTDWWGKKKEKRFIENLIRKFYFLIKENNGSDE